MLRYMYKLVITYSYFFKLYIYVQLIMIRCENLNVVNGYKREWIRASSACSAREIASIQSQKTVNSPDPFIPQRDGFW